MNLLARLLITLLPWLLVACGEADTTDRTKAKVRLVNASAGYAQLELREDGTLRQGPVAYAASESYAEVDPKPKDLSIHAAGSATALATLVPTLEKNKHYTLLAYGNAGALGQLLLDDNAGAPESNRTLLRVVHAAPDAGALDVYLTAAGDELAASVPTQPNARYGADSGWLTLTSGTWRLRVTAQGSKTDLRLDTAALELGSRKMLTLVLAPARGAMLVNALVLEQQTGIARIDGTQARVRAVAGAASGASVSASVGGTALMSGVGSPAVGAYQLVAAGTVTPVVAVNGNPVASPAATLLAGADYTLLVHGAPAAAQAAWLADDNRRPPTAGQARVRLVNGVAGASGSLAMTIDFLPLADGVTAGAASAYALTDASAAARVAVTAAGTVTALFLAPEQRIAGDEVYSVFVVGDHAQATGIVRKDR